MRALKLYRLILKEHRNKLPREMRTLGDTYVRAEFQQHKTAQPEQLKMFFTAWENYLELLKRQEGTYGRALDEDTASKLNDDQRSKLNDLKSQARSTADKED